MKDIILKMDDSKRKKLIIIISCLIIFNIVIGCIFAFNLNSKSNNGYTALKGDILKVKEIDTEIKIKVTSKLEIFSDLKNVNFSEDFVKLNLEIENLGEKKLDLRKINFALVDKNKNVIATSNYAYQNDQQIHNKFLGGNKKIRGSLFFDFVKDKASLNEELEKEVEKVNYLKVSVEVKDKKHESAMEDYYLSLK